MAAEMRGNEQRGGGEHAQGQGLGFLSGNVELSQHLRLNVRARAGANHGRSLGGHQPERKKKRGRKNDEDR